MHDQEAYGEMQVKKKKNFRIKKIGKTAIYKINI